MAGGDLMPDPATRYAEDVVEGRVVTGRLARLACERHLRDLETGRDRGLYYDPLAAIRPLRFAKHSCRFWEGRGFAGNPVVFSPWQAFRIGCAFGWKREDTGFRRFNVAYGDVAKKNGKSTEGGVIGNYGFIADGEPGPQVYAFATRRDQAKIVFNAARQMVIKSPRLARRIDPRKAGMECRENAGIFKPLGADADSFEGTNPSLAIGDEIHVHKTRDAWDNIRSAMASRAQPLLWAITTAGDASDPHSLYNVNRQYAESVLAGEIEDDSYFAYIACLDLHQGESGLEGDDWEDEDVWIKANPNLDVSVTRSYLRGEVKRALISPEEQNSILRKHMNYPTQARELVIPMDKWRAAAAPEKDMSWEALRGRPCYPGVDLALRIDLSVIAWVFPPVDADPKWRFKWDCFLPAVSDEELLEKSRAAGRERGYLDWKHRGWLRVSDTPILDQSDLRVLFKQRAEMLNVVKVGIDPHKAQQLGNELIDQDGFDAQAVRQGYITLSAPTRLFIELVATGGLAHDGNPIASWCAGNMALRRDANDNIAPDKLKAGRKIDCIVAAITGMALAMDDRQNQVTSYLARRDAALV